MVSELSSEDKVRVLDKLIEFIIERYVKAFNEPEGSDEFVDGQLSILEELIEIIDSP